MLEQMSKTTTPFDLPTKEIETREKEIEIVSERKDAGASKTSEIGNIKQFYVCNAKKQLTFYIQIIPYNINKNS